MSGDKCKVYIEYPDGRLIEVNAIIMEIRSEVTCRTFAGDPAGIITDLNMRVIGDIEISQPWEWKNKLDARRSAIEWRCDYCDSVNMRHHRHCTKCGASRSFIYG